MKERVEFERSDQALERRRKKDKTRKRIWKSDPTSQAIFWLSHKEQDIDDQEGFCEIFGEYGFIPGYNMKSIKRQEET